MSGWPDPEKPGYPANHEVDGFHWLFDPENKKSYPEIWVAEIGAWAVGDAWTPRMVAEMGLHYQGPCLTPSEVDALPVAVAGIVSSMRVDLADGYRLATKVALAALEPSDGTYYPRDYRVPIILKCVRDDVQKKLEQAAEAWGIKMTEPPHD
jgi:hypothetical protein